MMDAKICTKCKLLKWDDEFRPAPTSRYLDKLRSQCIECEKAYNKSEIGKASRKRYQKKFEQSYKGKEFKLKYHYGESAVQNYKDAYAAQNGKCTICKCELQYLSKSTCYDHNHTTGEFRGLLCSLCNRGLGYFKDNPELLISASKYLLTNQN